MTYEQFKAKRDEIETELHKANLRLKSIFTAEDYDYLLYFIDEYEELTRQMLQYIKSKEIAIRGKEWEEVPEPLDKVEDDSWLSHYFSLDK